MELQLAGSGNSAFECEVRATYSKVIVRVKRIVWDQHEFVSWSEARHTARRGISAARCNQLSFG